MHIVAEFQVADDHARSVGSTAAFHPGTTGNTDTTSRFSVVANAHVVADLNLIVAPGAVTDVVPELEIGEKANLPRARREQGTDLRHDNGAVTLKYSPETGDDLV
jgi:hypothetical protein